MCPVGGPLRLPLKGRFQRGAGRMGGWEHFLPLHLTSHCRSFRSAGYLGAGASGTPKMEQARYSNHITGGAQKSNFSVDKYHSPATRNSTQGQENAWQRQKGNRTSLPFMSTQRKLLKELSIKMLPSDDIHLCPCTGLISSFILANQCNFLLTYIFS